MLLNGTKNSVVLNVVVLVRKGGQPTLPH
jgi:hypothetical protein